MAAKADEWCSAFERRVEALTKLATTLCELIVAAMMLLITAEVISRDVFDFSFQITEEVSGYLLVGIIFLAANVALRDGALFRVEFLYSRLSSRIQPFFRLAFDMMSLAAAVVLEYSLIFLLISSYVRGDRSDSYLAAPLYMPQIVMPVGFALLILLLLSAIARDLLDIRNVVSKPSGAK